MKKIFIIFLIIVIIITIIITIIYYLFTKTNNKIIYKTNNKIPKIIYQTYKDKNVPSIVKERWMKLNPEYQYYLYDDDDCYNFLIKYYGKKHADFFKHKIKDGPIKSDFFRVCILYIFGGIYADIDIIPHVPIIEFLDSDTTLYTCISHEQPNLNPHFIGVTPKNILIKKCIDIYIKDKINKSYDYLDYSITHIFYNILTKYLNNNNLKEGIYKQENQIIQLSQEICNNSYESCHIKNKGRNIMNSRDGNIYNSSLRSFY
jgi:mannosyltransferase OCH1-like enzyme